MSVEAVVDQYTKVSVRARVVSTASRLMLRPLLTYWPLTGWAIRPLSLIDTAAGLLPAPRRVRFDRVDFGGFVGEWVRPRSVVMAEDTPVSTASVAPAPAEEPGAVVYLHGGAFLACGMNTHRPAVARIAAACGLPVLSVAYRQLPTVRLAGSVEDCVSVYKGLLAEGIPADRIILAGDSAGGYLAFATALSVRAEGLPGRRASWRCPRGWTWIRRPSSRIRTRPATRSRRRAGCRSWCGCSAWTRVPTTPAARPL